MTDLSKKTKARLTIVIVSIWIVFFVGIGSYALYSKLVPTDIGDFEAQYDEAYEPELKDEVVAQENEETSKSEPIKEEIPIVEEPVKEDSVTTESQKFISINDNPTNTYTAYKGLNPSDKVLGDYSFSDYELNILADDLWSIHRDLVQSKSKNEMYDIYQSNLFLELSTNLSSIYDGGDDFTVAMNLDRRIYDKFIEKYGATINSEAKEEPIHGFRYEYSYIQTDGEYNYISINKPFDETIDSTTEIVWFAMNEN